MIAATMIGRALAFMARGSASALVQATEPRFPGATKAVQRTARRDLITIDAHRAIFRSARWASVKWPFACGLTSMKWPDQMQASWNRGAFDAVERTWKS